MRVSEKIRSPENQVFLEVSKKASEQNVLKGAEDYVAFKRQLCKIGFPNERFARTKSQWQCLRMQKAFESRVLTGYEIECKSYEEVPQGRAPKHTGVSKGPQRHQPKGSGGQVTTYLWHRDSNRAWRCNSRDAETCHWLLLAMFEISHVSTTTRLWNTSLMSMQLNSRQA